MQSERVPQCTNRTWATGRARFRRDQAVKVYVLCAYWGNQRFQAVRRFYHEGSSTAGQTTYFTIQYVVMNAVAHCLRMIIRWHARRLADQSNVDAPCILNPIMCLAVYSMQSPPSQYRSLWGRTSQIHTAWCTRSTSSLTLRRANTWYVPNTCDFDL